MDADSLDQKPAPRKLKFKPKPQARRVPNPVAPKTEATDDAESAERKELFRLLRESRTAKPKAQRKVESAQVAFGYGHNYNGNYSSCDDAASFSSLTDDEEYVEPWNYYSYYPTVLPLRRPYSGNPELLNEQEFGQVSVFDEGKLNPAMELGFMEEDLEPKMLFFQLPRGLPMTKRAAAVEAEASASNSKPPGGANPVERPCGFNELKSGLMGKLLVYKSGAVKLKLGDTEYDVSPGSDCGFAQDVVAVNVDKKHCCVVGELSKHAIVTPDVDSILDSLPDLG
ncbi:hypothetical protein RND81_07G064400 [Saponaria officinalis]|uniref:Uncharacterized protein n=1 Tax=Saponaria officinalis TaxID=3572 RepID=A0AAW1JSG9_SAPOF